MPKNPIRHFQLESESRKDSSIEAMIAKPIRLYSEQGIDLRSFSGPLDRSRGTYVEHLQIRTAQERLYREFVGTDQVIWCSRKPLETVPLKAPQYIHTINADTRGFLISCKQTIFCVNCKAVLLRL